MKKITLPLLAVCFALSSLTFAQNIGINNTGASPNASALLDVDAAPSNNKGILVPRIPLTITTSNAPVGAGIATSLLVYNTATANDVTPGYYYWDGTKWVRFLNTVNAWMLNGNAGTTSGPNFLGTTDSVDLMFKVNNQMAGLIDMGSQQTFFGHRAGYSATAAATLSTLIGYKTGTNITTGLANTALGFSALRSNVVGDDNTMVGVDAGYYQNTGGYNTAVGMWSLEGNSTITPNTGIANTALGFCAGGGYLGTPGSGTNNYLQTTSGSYNTFLGYSTAMSAGTFSNTTTLGAFAEVGQNDAIIIGGVSGTNGCTRSPNIGIGTMNPNVNGAVHINSNATNSTMWCTSNYGANLIIGGPNGARNPAIAMLDVNGNNPFAIANAGNLVITRMPALGNSAVQQSYDLNIFQTDGHTELGVLAGGNPAFYRNLVVSGKTGLFVNPINTLDVNGGTAMGTYAGINAAPANGAIISGKVGIGTTNPSQFLQVGGLVGGSTATPYAIDIGGDYSNTPGANLKLRVYDDGTNIYGIGVSAFQLDYSISNNNINNRHVFYYGTNELMRIQGNGNVGIGTAGPLDKLTVSLAASATPIAAMSIDVASFITVPNSQASYFFRVRDIGAGNFTPFYIQGDGNVGIGGTTTPTAALHVVGNICYTGGIGACSDVRYKKNFNPLENALQNVLKINGLTYNWRTEEFPDNKFTTDKQIGFIAQDLEKIYPEVVITNSDGYKSVDYAKLTPILVEAIKEQQKIIEGQQSSINDLRAENKDFKAKYEDRLKALESIIGGRAQK